MRNSRLKLAAHSAGQNMPVHTSEVLLAAIRARNFTKIILNFAEIVDVDSFTHQLIKQEDA